jgi:hypothetical protein
MLKRFILWDFPRGGWQYDVVVGLVCAFLFLTPRSWFRDQPRMHRPGGIAVAQADHGALLFFIDAADLAGIPAEQQITRLTSILRTQMGNNRLQVKHLEPILDSDGEMKGYWASATP